MKMYGVIQYEPEVPLNTVYILKYITVSYTFCLLDKCLM